LGRIGTIDLDDHSMEYRARDSADHHDWYVVCVGHTTPGASRNEWSRRGAPPGETLIGDFPKGESKE
jgi:hypothetical protein